MIIEELHFIPNPKGVSCYVIPSGLCRAALAVVTILSSLRDLFRRLEQPRRLRDENLAVRFHRFRELTFDGLKLLFRKFRGGGH